MTEFGTIVHALTEAECALLPFSTPTKWGEVGAVFAIGACQEPRRYWQFFRVVTHGKVVVITFVTSVLGTLSDDEARANGSASRRLASRLHRLGEPRQSGADIVAALIHQIPGDPVRPLPRRRSEVDQMAALREPLPTPSRAAGGRRPHAILGGPEPTGYTGSKVQLALLAETAQHLAAAARPWVNSTTDHPTNGAGASARQNTPVNTVRRCPPSGSETPEEGWCHLITAASGRPERGAGP